MCIVKADLDAILRWEWLFKINLVWNRIKALTVIEQKNLPKLLEEYADLFDEIVGKIKNYECKHELIPYTGPAFLQTETIAVCNEKAC